jgi:hypothetical protein
MHSVVSETAHQSLQFFHCDTCGRTVVFEQPAAADVGRQAAPKSGR